MKQHEAQNGSLRIENPEEVRLRRDQALALAYVQRGQTRTAMGDLARENDMDRTTVWRAIGRQLKWALAQVALQKEKADSPDKDCPPAISTEPEAEAPVTDSVTQDAASTPHTPFRTA